MPKKAKTVPRTESIKKMVDPVNEDENILLRSYIVKQKKKNTHTHYLVSTEGDPDE